MVKSADPNETSKCVRRPASRSRSSRSNPRTAPRAAASASRPSTSGHESDGILEASGSTGSLLLGRRDRLDSHRRQLEQLIQALARERLSLGGRLHLDEASLPGHDDVHVDLGTRVFRVVEVEQRLAVDYADGNGRDRVRQRLREPEPVEREPRRNVGAADRRAARAAVSLENVTVEPERPLAERPEIRHRPQGPADQTLDLDRAPSLLAARRFPLGALAGRRRKQRVLGGHPAPPLAHQPAGDALLDRGGAEDLRLALRVEHRPVRLLEPVRLQPQRAQLVRPPAIGACHAARLSFESSTCSTSAIGSCRNRWPSARKASGSPVVRNRYEPSRASSFSIPLRASVPATSRAVSSAEKTSVTPRPNTRWKTGRISG